MPLDAEVGPATKLMVVIMIAFTHHQEIEGQQVSGSIIYFEVYIAKFMGKPIDDGTMHRAHEKMKRQ